MHIEFIVEELSAEAALGNLVPRILGPECAFAIHPYQGKKDLLSKLPGRLRGYRRWLPCDGRIVVLVDCDADDCKQLKSMVEGIARREGFFTRATPDGQGVFTVVTRLAIEELEAWFFGDVEAIAAAYGGVPPSLSKRQSFRDPDRIAGGTWEALERVLQGAGHHLGGLSKITAARDISAHMEPGRNRSRSFQVFRDGLRSLAAAGATTRSEPAGRSARG